MVPFSKLFNNIKYLSGINSQPSVINKQSFGVSNLGVRTEIDYETVREAVYPQWFFATRLGQPRRVDTNKIRTLAKSAWVQMVLNTFKREISTIDWKIVPVNEDDGIDHTDDINKVTEFLSDINNNQQSINDVNSELITDVGEIDAGVFNYVYSEDSYTIGESPTYDARGLEIGTQQGLVIKPLGQRRLMQIKAVDGGSMLKNVDIFKNTLNYFQYSFKHPTKNPTRFTKEEISYLVMNKKSYSIYGFSPVQSIQQVLELLIQGTRYNKDLYTNNAIPDFIATLPDLPPDDLEKLKQSWLNKYQGKPHQVGFINWAVGLFQKLNDSNRDLEWLDGQKWYFKIVFAAFGVSPTEAGFFENANQSNDEGQARVTVRNAIKPYLTMLEHIHTIKTVPEILQNEKSGLKYKFFPKDHIQEKLEFEQYKWEIENGCLTINDYRALQGKEPYEWGDEPYKKPGQQTSFNFGGNPLNNPNNEEEVPVDDDDDDTNKTYKKKDNLVEEGEEMIEESDDYSEFLFKTFNGFEKAILIEVNKLDLNKSYKTTKTINNFITNVFGIIYTQPFANKIKRIVKESLLNGLLSSENELEMDIGFTDLYKQENNRLAQQQLNGYTINGAPWPGIKGVSKEIQAKVIKIVQTGINEHGTISDIREKISESFDVFSESRSEVIARTETNRIVNEGKLLGYKESGLQGGKIVKVAMDGRTTEICINMNKKYGDKAIPLDEMFVDDTTQKVFSTPPFHPNCRTTISFRTS